MVKTTAYLTAAAILLLLAPACGLAGAAVGYVAGMQWTGVTIRKIWSARNA